MQDVLNWLKLPLGNYMQGVQLMKAHFPNAPELGVLVKMDTLTNRKIIKAYLSKLVQQPEKKVEIAKIGTPSVVIAKASVGKATNITPTFGAKTPKQREWGADGRKMLDTKSRVVNQRHIISNQNAKNDSLSQEERADLYEQAKILFARQIEISKELDSYQKTGLFADEKPTKNNSLTNMSDEALVHLYRSANSQISRAKKIKNDKLLEKWQQQRIAITAELNKRGVKTT